jgi:hypothetical protein
MPIKNRTAANANARKNHALRMQDQDYRNHRNALNRADYARNRLRRRAQATKSYHKHFTEYQKRHNKTSRIVDGRHSHPLYHAWAGMRKRCHCTTGKAWANYGGRGITIAPRWNNFWTFVTDMGPRPAGFTIERIDNDGNYTPTNCCWIPRGDQNKNKRHRTHAEMLLIGYVAGGLHG